MSETPRMMWVAGALAVLLSMVFTDLKMRMGIALGGLVAMGAATAWLAGEAKGECGKELVQEQENGKRLGQSLAEAKARHDDLVAKVQESQASLRTMQAAHGDILKRHGECLEKSKARKHHMQKAAVASILAPTEAAEAAAYSGAPVEE